MCKPLTTGMLISRILRWNLGNALIGGLLLVWALLLWWGTLALLTGVMIQIQERGRIAREHRKREDHRSRDQFDTASLTASGADSQGEDSHMGGGIRGVLSLPATWYGRLSPASRWVVLIFIAIFSALGVRAFRVLRFARPSGRNEMPEMPDENEVPAVMGLLIVLPVLAPVCTFWSLRYFGSMILPWPGRVREARKVYRLLCAAGGWQAYPPLRSQRRALQLLARLGYVRISRRFGEWEVKANTVSSHDET